MSVDPKQLHQAFSKAPLRPDQMDLLYVPLDSLRGDYHTVNRLADTIRTSGEATTQILCGHNGSGKSTELMMLKRELEKGTPKYFVVHCIGSDDIDRNDVDFPEVLIGVVRQLATQLKDREQIELKPGYFKTRFESLKDLFGSSIDFNKFDLRTGLLDVSGTIKNSPSTRHLLREAMEPDTKNLLHAANDIIGVATKALVSKGYAGLVIIFDDLDKMIVRPMADGHHSTDEHLFVNRSPQMAGFECHMVYSMPLSLAYSRHHADLKNFYGDQLPVVPMVNIRTPPPNRKPHRPGIDAMRKMIDKRLASINASWRDVFENEDVCEELIRLSGGQPSELMGSIREALIADGLPITAKSLERVRREGQREFRRQLRRELWSLIELYRTDSGYVVDSDRVELLNELIDSRALLQYVNGSEWYGLNPFVEMLTPPAGLASNA